MAVFEVYTALAVRINRCSQYASVLFSKPDPQAMRGQYLWYLSIDLDERAGCQICPKNEFHIPWPPLVSLRKLWFLRSYCSGTLFDQHTLSVPFNHNPPPPEFPETVSRNAAHPKGILCCMETSNLNQFILQTVYFETIFVKTDHVMIIRCYSLFHVSILIVCLLFWKAISSLPFLCVAHKYDFGSLSLFFFFFF